MKYLIIILFFIRFSVWAQSTFELGVGRLQVPGDFDQTADHGFIVGGNMLDTLSGLDDVYSLVKIDSLGNEQWAGMYFDGGHDSYVSSVFQSSDGNFVFSGFPDGLFTHECVIAKVNSNGQLIWSTNFCLPGYSSAIYSQCLETNDGNYAIAFNQSASMFDPAFTSLVKLDPSGNVLWEKNYQDTDYLGVSHSIANTSDNGFILTGTTYGINYSAPFLLKTDSIGTPLWSKAYFIAPYNIPGADVKQAFDGGFIITCSDITFSGDANVIKTDSLGNIQWTTTLTGNELHSLSAVEQTSDSNYILTGSVGDYNNNTQRLLLVKLDQAGDTIWTRTYQAGNGINLGGIKIQTSNDGGLFLLNMVFIITQIMKTDSNGNLNCDHSFSTTTVQHNASSSFGGNLLFDSIQCGTNVALYNQFYPPSTILECSSVNVTSEVPTQNKLCISPNPASNKISISCSVPISAINIFNSMGELVEKIQDSRPEIDIKSLPNGVYFLQIITDSEILFKKMVKQ